MKILGIDPGTLFTGFGIVEYNKNELTYVTSGVVKINPSNEQPQRLQIIYDELDSIIKKYKPDEFALETAFYGKNAQSALKIGYARAVSMLVAIHNGLSIKEYSPREIKKAVVGNGAATKEQVQFMMKKLLMLKKEKMKLDETDGLAVAVCHSFKISMPVKKSKNWKEFIAANPDRVID